MMLYPSNFLIGSQLTPEELGKHYLTGSKQYFNGMLIFAEIDADFRHPYFDIDRGLEQVVLHEDGTPKATKFISSYRVLENINFSSIKKLYISSAAGEVMGIESQPYKKPANDSRFKIYAGISPLRVLSVSTLDLECYGKNITTNNRHKGAPQFFFTQLEFDSRKFRIRFDENPFMPTPIPGIHPSILRARIDSLKENPEKTTKGLQIDPWLRDYPLTLLRHGFMFYSESQSFYFPLPEVDEIEERFYRFYRSM